MRIWLYKWRVISTRVGCQCFVDSLLQLALSATKIADWKNPFPTCFQPAACLLEKSSLAMWPLANWSIMAAVRREHYCSPDFGVFFAAQEVVLVPQNLTSSAVTLGAKPSASSSVFLGGTAASASVNPTVPACRRDGWEATRALCWFPTFCCFSGWGKPTRNMISTKPPKNGNMISCDLGIFTVEKCGVLSRCLALRGWSIWAKGLPSSGPIEVRRVVWKNWCLVECFDWTKARWITRWKSKTIRKNSPLKIVNHKSLLKQWLNFHKTKLFLII